MRVYFVRHAQTVANVSGAVQTADTPITDKGVQQCQQLALRFSDVPVEAVISSDYARTKDTARAIAEELDLDVEISPLLHELTNPNDWTLDDEKTFPEFKRRARQALDLIEARKEDTFIVVSHGNFIRLLVSTMIFGEALAADDFLNVCRAFWIHNTGIVTCNYENGLWNIITWNDHAHLEAPLE